MKGLSGKPLIRPSHPTYQIFPEFAAVIAQPEDTMESLAEKFLGDRKKSWIISDFNRVKNIRPGDKLIIPLETPFPGGLINGGYQTTPVLAYHKFSHGMHDAMTVKAKDFESQMNYLQNHGYHVIDMDSFFSFLDGSGWIPKKSVLITVDDGWRSFYEIAYPILKKHGYPATLFVYTDLITGNSKTLDWDMIREMSKNGIDIQCHSRTHRNFNVMKENESAIEYFKSVKSEIIESAQIIKEKTGKRVKFFAYPYGEDNYLAVAILEKSGFKGAFTVDRKSNPFFVDRYRIGRRMIYGYYNLPAFKKNLSVFSNEAIR